MKAPVYVCCVVAVVSLAGCGDTTADRPRSSRTAESQSRPGDAAQAPNESEDVDLAPSEKTVDEARAFIKAGMTTDELHEFLRTTPVLVRQSRFHWMLRDGSLWTDFNPTKKGAVIVNSATEKKTR